MIGALRRPLRPYGALAAVVVAQRLSYRLWFWVDLFGQLLSVIVFSAFWHAVYDGRDTVGGLTATQTITYVLIAQVLSPAVQGNPIAPFGQLVREGRIAVELLRPTDLQAVFYVQGMAGTLMQLLRLGVPSVLVAALALGLRVPHDPRVWGAFVVTLFLGTTVIFLFDWMFACCAFYTTETWGLSELRNGLFLFFSGALLPLDLMPGALRTVVAGLPFAQAVYAPMAIFAGITPVAAAPRVWLVQLAWIAGLLVASRLTFRVAVRRVTLHGG